MSKSSRRRASTALKKQQNKKDLWAKRNPVFLPEGSEEYLKAKKGKQTVIPIPPTAPKDVMAVITNLRAAYFKHIGIADPKHVKFKNKKHKVKIERYRIEIEEVGNGL